MGPQRRRGSHYVSGLPAGVTINLTDLTPRMINEIQRTGQPPVGGRNHFLCRTRSVGRMSLSIAWEPFGSNNEKELSYVCAAPPE
jgi:hypothetical protein